VDVVLGANQYGKAEVRMVTLDRTGAQDVVRDLTVSIALSGDLVSVHTTGDNAHVVATDTQKNTVFAFAEQAPVGEIEDFALRLARHFAGGFEAITRARVHIAETGWERLDAHNLRRAGDEARTATVVADSDGSAHVVSGLQDLVVMKTAGSEFTGYVKDRFTTLPETRDRILATAVAARWRHAAAEGDWGESFAAARSELLDRFAAHHSLSLQQTLYEMGAGVLRARPEVAEIRLSLPNRHHFVVDLSPFGLENDNEVFRAEDRPYGLIEAVLTRPDAPPAGPAWDPYPLVR
jgi:urate oxidase